MIFAIKFNQKWWQTSNRESPPSRRQYGLSPLFCHWIMIFASPLRHLLLCKWKNAGVKNRDLIWLSFPSICLDWISMKKSYGQVKCVFSCWHVCIVKRSWREKKSGVFILQYLHPCQTCLIVNVFQLFKFDCRKDVKASSVFRTVRQNYQIFRISQKTTKIHI